MTLTAYAVLRCTRCNQARVHHGTPAACIHCSTPHTTTDKEASE